MRVADHDHELPASARHIFVTMDHKVLGVGSARYEDFAEGVARWAGGYRHFGDQLDYERGSCQLDIAFDS